MGTNSLNKRRWYRLPEWIEVLLVAIGCFLFFLGVANFFTRWADISTIYLGQSYKAEVITSIENDDFDCIGKGRSSWLNAILCLGERYYYYRIRLVLLVNNTEYVQELFPKRLQERLQLTKGDSVPVRLSRDQKHLAIDERVYGYVIFPTETPLFGLGYIAMSLFILHFFGRRIWLTLSSIQIYRKLKRLGATTTGTVEFIDKPYRDIRKNAMIDIRFSFRDSSGRRRRAIQHSVRGEMTDFIGDAFSAVGVAVPILYNPKNPKQAAIDWEKIQDSR